MESFDFESLDLDSLAFESSDFDSLDFESPDFDSLADDELLSPAVLFSFDLLPSLFSPAGVTAELDFSVSENPTLRFHFVPHARGELRAEVTDSKDGQYVGTLALG